MLEIIDTHDLFNFSFCAPFFDEKLEELSELAEPEIWTHRPNQPLHILKHYIMDTFKKSSEKNLIIYGSTGKHAAFNTGLLTSHGDDIIGLFEENTRPNSQKWYLKGFYEKTNWEYLKAFNEIPPLVTFHVSFEDYYFNPDLKIHFNVAHIVEDNKKRLLDTLKFDDDSSLLMMLKGAWELTLPRIRRNVRMVIPQYYNNKISYLVPIFFDIKGEKVTMAMAVEKLENNQYRANTIFTLEMAYAQARLVMRPEADWITKKGC